MIQVTSVPPAASVDPHWTVYWGAFATPFVALVAAAIAASIAYRQWQTATAAAATARNKLKLDLFERRFTVFQAVAQLMARMSSDTSHDDKAVMKLITETAGVEFLFDAEVNRYLVEQLYDRTAAVMRDQLERVHARARGDQPAVDTLTEELAANRRWFDGQLPVWKDLTRPFLELTH